MEPADLKRIKESSRQTGFFTVYPSPKALIALIGYWTDPRFGNLLNKYNSKTPPPKDILMATVKEILLNPLSCPLPQ